MRSFRLLGTVLLLSSAGIVAQNEGIVTTIAGGGTPHEGGDVNCEDSATSMDGVGINARFNYPWGIQFDPLENVVYIADCGCPDSIQSNDRIRKIDVMSGQVTTLAGDSQGYKDGTGKDAKFHHTSGMVIDQQERVLYVADSGNNRIRKVNLKTAQVNTFVGSGEYGFIDDVGVRAQLNNPQQLEIDTVTGRRLFLSDTDNHAIRVISLAKGDVTTLAGGSSGLKDGEGREAKFLHPTGISLDLYSGILYVADHYNHVIRTVDTKNGKVTTLAGGGKQGFIDGQGNEARFNYPEGLYFDSHQQILYVVEFDNHAIRTVTPKGEVRTLAGGTKGRRDGIGAQARFFHPTGLTFDPRVKRIYVTDQYNHLVRSVTGIGSSAVDPHRSALSETFRKAKSSPYLFVCIVLSIVCVPMLLQWFRRGRRRLLRSY